MCSCEDAERPTFCNVTRPKARKLHRCCECNSPIQPGDRYERISGKWDGDMGTYTTCLFCEALRDVLSDALGCSPPLSNLIECLDSYADNEGADPSETRATLAALFPLVYAAGPLAAAP
jgi:hypothetical protein